MNAVLGIDLASASWASNGSALIAWTDTSTLPALTRVEAGIVAWPVDEALTPHAMAAEIDTCARRWAVRAVAIDGPHAWRDPARGSDGPGVGRWAEYLVRAQGKTGVNGAVYPRTQLAWTRLSIAVFDALLARPGVRLAESGACPATAVRAHVGEERDEATRVTADDAPACRSARASDASADVGYLLLESYPTATWRAAGLAPLPAKARRPPVPDWHARLAAAFHLPRGAAIRGHDDLQAVVAALAAVGVAGGPVRATWHGHPCRVVDGVRVEGGIWVAST